MGFHASAGTCMHDMQSKETIRRQLLAQRQRIPDEIRRRHDRAVFENITSFGPFCEAATVALYAPVRAEVDLTPLLGVPGKIYLFPKVDGRRLVFSPARTIDELVPGAFGIPEPASGERVDAQSIDIVFVPGIAFDRRGHRLGYGKGYYDRLMADNPGLFCAGVCLEEFLLEELPTDPWDARVACVVTQAGIYNGGDI